MGNYVEYAVDSVAAHMTASLQAELTTVEGETGLGSGDLAMPTIVKHFRPDDNQSPLLLVYDDRGIVEGDQRNGLWTIPIVTVIQYDGDSSVEAGTIHVRRYVTAMMRVMVKDETLNGTVYLTNFAGGDALRVQGDKSTTRHLYGLSWAVRIQEREN